MLRMLISRVFFCVSFVHRKLVNLKSFFMHKEAHKNQSTSKNARELKFKNSLVAEILLIII